MKKTDTLFIGFITGIVVGTAVGLLYAPEKGTNTRRRVSYKLDKYRGLLDDILDKLLADRTDNTVTSAQEESKKVVDFAKGEAEKLRNEMDSFRTKSKVFKKKSNA